MLLLILQLSSWVCAWRLSKGTTRAPDFAELFKKDLREIAEMGQSAAPFRNFLRRQQSLDARHRLGIESAKITFGFHCLLASSAVLISLLARLSSPPLDPASDFSLIGALVHSSIVQNTLLWWHIRLAPKSWFWDQSVSGDAATLSEAFKLACCGIPTNNELLAPYEQVEINSGISTKLDKFRVIREACEERWHRLKLNRSRWQSIRPVFEMIALSFGICPALMLLLEQKF